MKKYGNLSLYYFCFPILSGTLHQKQGAQKKERKKEKERTITGETWFIESFHQLLCNVPECIALLYTNDSVHGKCIKIN